MKRSETIWSRLGILGVVTICVLLAGAVEAPDVTLYRVCGNSMLPTFRHGDRIAVTTVGTVEVGDAVVVFHEGDVLIKRVIGVPGDTIEVVGGVVYRDGVRTPGPTPFIFRDRSNGMLCELEVGQYYIVGDNRAISIDSRSFGPVTRESILGCVVHRWDATGDGITPSAAARTVENRPRNGPPDR